jgi:hypothetical protein
MISDSFHNDKLVNCSVKTGGKFMKIMVFFMVERQIFFTVSNSAKYPMIAVFLFKKHFVRSEVSIWSIEAIDEILRKKILSNTISICFRIYKNIGERSGRVAKKARFGKQAKDFAYPSVGFSRV